MEKKELPYTAELLTDQYAKKILSGCYEQGMSAQALSWEYNIPIAAVYRRLKSLKEAGFVKTVDQKAKKGNKSTLYKTSINKAELVFEEGSFRLKLNIDGKDIELEY